MKLRYLVPLTFMLLTACQLEQEAQPTFEETNFPPANPIESASPEPAPVSTSTTAASEKPGASPTANDPADSGLESESVDKSTNEGTNMSDTADADVTFVQATMSEGGFWAFQVTVSHPDTGWEDYADGWDVVLPGGTVLKVTSGDPFTRLLLHPHVSEQPFTRSQSRLRIPAGIETVTVRAHESVYGFGGREIAVNLMIDSGG